MAAPGSNFSYFRDQIAALAPNPGMAELRGGQFLLHEGTYDVHYAPFDGINTAARVTLVGITPGWTQMQQAFETARAALARGDDDEEVLHLVKRDASFKGMRDTLVRYLDGIGVAEALGIGTTSELFGARRDLLHTTSILRYPVFVDGKNYSGSGTPITDVAVLRDMVDNLFAPEIAAVPNSLVVPLGKKVDDAVATLVRAGSIDPARVVTGFPHPSGANAHGPSQYRANQPAMTETVRRWSDGGSSSAPRSGAPAQAPPEPAPAPPPEPPPPVPAASAAAPRPQLGRRGRPAHKGMYRVPGGKDNFLDGLARILAHVETGSAADLEGWIVDEFGGSAQTARSVVSFLDKAGLIATPRASEYLRTRDPVLVVDALADNFVFFTEALEMCREGATIEDVRRAGNATGEFKWGKANQPRLRLHWLEQCGMARSTGGVYRATPAGLAWLDAQ